MADPQVLYVVTGVVLLALVAWVMFVLVRAPNAGVAATPAPQPVEEPTPKAKSETESLLERASGEGAKAVVVEEKADTPSKRPPMQSHQEIQDTSGQNDKDQDPHDEDEATGPHALILVTAVGRTDPGLKRKNNEDAYLILPEHHLLVIADGMGRHAAGEVASKLAVEAIADAFNNDVAAKAPADPMLVPRANRLRNAVLVANERILARAGEKAEYSGMGTTVVAAFFSPNKQKVYLAHVGDSRCYRVRRGELKQLTVDHTLGTAGISGSTASMLSRAVGVDESVDVDVTIESPRPGDVYLLCSDGLTRMATSDEILATITSSASLEIAASKLIAMANERGGKDNITTIIAGVEAATLPSAGKLAT